MKLIFKGTVESGRVKLDSPESYLVLLSSLEGKRVELTLDKERNKRTDLQNKYYWGVIIVILSQHFGYETEEMHEALKLLFLRKHEDTLVTVGSTARLSTIEFGEYIDKIIRWAASEHQIVIPDANEYL